MTEAGLLPHRALRERFSVAAVCATVMAVAVLGAGLAACSSGSDDSGAPATTASGTADSSGTPGSTAAGSADAAVQLSDALGTLGVTYHFVTTVRVGDEQVLTAEGDRVGEGARLELTAEGGTVSYLVTGDSAWAKPENGDWAELDAPPATSDPIEALGAPRAVSFGPETEGVQVLAVEVDNGALGLSGGGTSTLTVTIVDGRLDQVTYNTVVGERTASATTIFSEVRDPSEVVAPL